MLIKRERLNYLNDSISNHNQFVKRRLTEGVNELIKRIIYKYMESKGYYFKGIRYRLMQVHMTHDYIPRGSRFSEEEEANDPPKIRVGKHFVYYKGKCIGKYVVGDMTPQDNN